MARAKVVSAAVDHRRKQVDLLGQAEAQWFHVTGEIEVFGAGAATISVLFPVYFTEKPRFSFGSELAPGEAYTPSNMPTCSVSVLSWDQRGRTDDSAIYTGATLCAVTTGAAAQTMIAFWHMEGVGLTEPSQL